MIMSKRMGLALCGCILTSSTLFGADSANTGRERKMPELIERFTADADALDHTYIVETSAERFARFTRFHPETLASLAQLDFDSMMQDDKLVLTDEKGGTATVTIANVNQSNGEIQVIDTVLMPN